MAQSTFYFKASNEQFTKALSQVKKSMQQVAKQTVALQASLKLLGAAVNSVAKLLTNVLGAALKGIVNLVKSVLNTIKNLVVGAFKFIKSALSTLLNWIKRALGTVFDWLKNAVKSAINGLKTITSEAVKLAKKAISEIIDDVQAFADKEYNQIQLKVSLGDSYSAVMKDFNSLLKMTTADKNDLLSVYATFAELGKKPEEVVKYAKATVYLSNATGRSLSQITRLLLGQEAAGRDLEKVLARVGVSLSGQEESISNVEKIINQLDDEMNALATGSLNQVFANIKNDIISIRENIGYIFSGPVRYIAQKVEGLLDKIAGSNKIEGLANKLNSWFDKIKPFIDKVFDMVERIMQDPEGFLKALWSDIQTIFNNIKKNFWDYLNIFGYLLGKGLDKLGDILGDVEWDNVVKSFTALKEGLSNFTIDFALGAGWIEAEDKVEGSLTKTFKNAWNRAHPEFELKESDSWLQNLVTLLSAGWELAIKPLWEGTIKPYIFDPIIDWWNKNWPNIQDTLITTFKYLGEVLGIALNNAVASSDVIRKVLNVIPGVNFATEAEAADVRASLYAKTKDLLPAGWTANDLTKENLMGYKVGNSNLMAQLFKYATKEISWLRKYTILEQKEYPSFTDFVNDLVDIWTPAEDAAAEFTTSLEETAAVTTEIADELERRMNQIESSRPSLMFPGPKLGNTTADLPGIPKFAGGGTVYSPTLAIVGEKEPEAIIPLSQMPMGKFDFNPTKTGMFLSSSGKWVDYTWLNRALDDLGYMEKDLSLITKNTSEIYKFFNSPKARTTGGGGINTNPDMYLDENGVWQLKSDFQKFVENSKIGAFLQLQAKILLKVSKGVQTIFSKKFWSDAWDTIKAPFTKDFWNNVGKKIADKEEYHWYDVIEGIGNIIDKGLTKFFKTSFGGVGFLAQNGAFGSHLGNIYSNSFDEDGKFSILQMFSAIIQELIPYLQKGLEIIGPLFDQAFDILGNAVQILGERLGKVLLPILEAFVPFMKTLADIVIALAPVVESVLAPAIKIIAAILQILTGVLDKLMPVFAFLGATIQWISERIEYAIAGVINWLASWIPWVSSVEQKKPKSWQENYDNIIGTYEAQKANTISTPTASGSISSATASYNGATQVYITNNFDGSYIVGSNGMRELALIIKNTLEDIAYSGQSV